MTFVLIPGGWYDSSVYDYVTRRVRARKRASWLGAFGNPHCDLGA